MAAERDVIGRLAVIDRAALIDRLLNELFDELRRCARLRAAGLHVARRLDGADDRGFELGIRFLQVHGDLGIAHAAPHRLDEREVEQPEEDHERYDAEPDDRRDAEAERFEARREEQQRQDGSGHDDHESAHREPLAPAVAHVANDVDQFAASVHLGCSPFGSL